MFDVPVTTSPHSTDCGATCLKMLLAHYGTQADLAELLIECGTSVIGTTLRDLVRVAIARGFDAAISRTDAASLSTRDRPAIILWRYRHFVIFCGCDDAGNVVITDPDKGRYRMSLDSFSKLYSGIALFFGEPGELPAPADPVDAVLDELEEAMGDD